MPDIPSEVSAMLTSLSYAHRGVASFELYPTDGDKTFYVSGSGSPSYMTVSAEYAHSRNPFFQLYSLLPATALLLILLLLLLLLLLHIRQSHTTQTLNSESTA